MPQDRITVTIALFAIYRDAFGVERLEREFPPQTPVKAVLEQLIAERPELAPWRELTDLGLGDGFVPPDTHLRDGDEVVLIPPVSGGSPQPQ